MNEPRVLMRVRIHCADCDWTHEVNTTSVDTHTLPTAHILWHRTRVHGDAMPNGRRYPDPNVSEPEVSHETTPSGAADSRRRARRGLQRSRNRRGTPTSTGDVDTTRTGTTSPGTTTGATTPAGDGRVPWGDWPFERA